ncbi:MAG: hypothetical protein Q4D74_06940 [Comamonadaceae bacterium]|nr:hypothetical protein [Comamonadaceae bacterium]
MSARLPLMADLAHEHGVLLRQWAGAQQRLSDMAAAHACRCAALEAELLRQRARWIVATTRLLWGLGWPGLPNPRQEGQRRGAAGAGAAPADATGAIASVHDVLCQTGCAGHAHPWLDEASGECRLHRQPCGRQASAA